MVSSVYGHKGDVLIQIAETQRRLTSELEGIVSQTTKTFVSVTLCDKRLVPYRICFHLVIFSVPLVPVGGAAGDGQQRQNGHRLHCGE